jgi:magnesium-transporting ATPase (P-type)
MVTGDHPLTAESIARSLGLISGQTAEDLKEKGDQTSIPDSIGIMLNKSGKRNGYG